MSYDLTEKKLEDCLNALLDRMEEKGLLPKNYNRDAVLEDLKNSLTKAHDGHIPQDLFTDRNQLVKLMSLVSLSAQRTLDPAIKLDTLSLARAFFDKDLALKDRKAILGAFVLLATKIPGLPLPNDRELKQLVDKLTHKIEAMLHPENKADLQEALSEIQLFRLQLLGVAAEGYTMPILFQPGNAVGAADTAVRIGSGNAGLLFAMDSPDAQNINPEIRNKITACFESLAGSTTSVLDSLHDDLRNTLYHPPALKQGAPGTSS